MSSKIRIRRGKLKKLMFSGYRSQEELAKALGVGRRTIERDMRAIEKDINKELDKKLKIVIRNFLMRNRQKYNAAWNIFATTQNDSAKVGAIRILDDIDNNEIRVLQSVGLIRAVGPETRGPIVVKFEKPDWAVKNGGNNKNKVSTVGSTDNVPQE